MAALLSTLAAGAAGLALGAGFWRIATRLRDLEQRQAQDTTPPSSPPSLESRARPMLSALYREPAASPFSALGSVPGGQWVGIALVLGLMALVTSSLTSKPNTVATGTRDSSLVQLEGRLDSLDLVVGRLRDSLRVVASSIPASRPEPAPTRLARRSSPGSNTVLPAAPPPPTGTPIQ